MNRPVNCRGEGGAAQMGWRGAPFKQQGEIPAQTGEGIQVLLGPLSTTPELLEGHSRARGTLEQESPRVSAGSVSLGGKVNP